MQPNKYERKTDFTDRDGNDTNHAAINSELDSAADSINGIRDNIKLIQRDDGALQNGVVTAESLSNSALRALSAFVGDAVTDAQIAAEESKAAAVKSTNAALSMVLITSKSLATGSCEFTGLTSYSRYRLVIDGMTFSGTANSGGFAQIQIGTGATPVYITSGYGHRYNYWADQGGSASSTNSSAIMGAMNGVAVPANMRGMAICDLSGMSSAGRVLASYNAMISEGANAAVSFAIGSGALNIASAPTAVKISGSYLTLTGGTASLYGISQ